MKVWTKKKGGRRMLRVAHERVGNSIGYAAEEVEVATAADLAKFGCFQPHLTFRAQGVDGVQYEVALSDSDIKTIITSYEHFAGYFKKGEQA